MGESSHSRGPCVATVRRLLVALCSTTSLVACLGLNGLTEEPQPDAATPASSASPDGDLPKDDGGPNKSDGGEADGGPIDFDAASKACASNEAICTAGCTVATCLSASHVAADLGTYTRSPGLAAISITSAVAGDTTTGKLGALRGANTSPTTFEVIAGIGFVRVPQPSASPIGIWVFSSVSIAAQVKLTGSAAAMMVAANSFQIAPTGGIDVSAVGLTPGPGGFAGGGFRTAGSGCGGGGAPTGTGTSGDTGGTNGGGGGGGFGTNGGAGGTNGAAGAGGAGGSASACASALATILAGGSGGGGGDTSGTVAGPFGGGGGGAIQLTAMGALTIEGKISAGGGGGRTAEGNSRDGAGGGSGGAIFLESPAITIGATAGLYANGGGGGSGSAGTGNTCNGALAQNGSASLTTAAGSLCAHGYGGGGAVGLTAVGAGEDFSGAGGGGGGLGRIVLRTLPGATPAIASSSVSPPSSSNAFTIDKTLK